MTEHRSLIIDNLITKINLVRCNAKTSALCLKSLNAHVLFLPLIKYL